MKDSTLDAALSQLVQGTRREYEREATRRASDPPPELRFPERSRRPTWIAVAAVLLGVVALGALIASLGSWSAEELPAAVPVSAERDLDSESRGGSVERSPTVQPVPPATLEPDPAPPDPPAAPPRPAKHERAARASVDAELAALDALANKKWKAGDHKGATKLFEEIVRRGNRGRRADLAFGDLFSLARQQGLHQREASLRRRYLARFPRGRFADDARAWLCRHSERRAKQCWRAYLRERPRGTYRAEAERELDKLD